jgi:hypothetical protein
MLTTKKDLDALTLAGCQTPGCDHRGHDAELYLVAACCRGDDPESNEGPGLDASYVHGSGILRLSGRGCGQLVDRVLVGDKPPTN